MEDQYPEIIITADGSNTLYEKGVEETYHSSFGAVQESLHVFIRAGLETCHSSCLTVFEAGFGTGLNAYLTYLYSQKKRQKVRYMSVEKYPLPASVYESLNYPAFLKQGAEDFLDLHSAPWNEERNISSQFSLNKIKGDLALMDYNALPKFDLIYFDTFSPEKQSELWTFDIFKKIYNHTVQGGKLVTYCAKGSVRRTLNEAGFKTERLPGPQGKREMLIAVK